MLLIHARILDPSIVRERPLRRRSTNQHKGPTEAPVRLSSTSSDGTKQFETKICSGACLNKQTTTDFRKPRRILRSSSLSALASSSAHPLNQLLGSISNSLSCSTSRPQSLILSTLSSLFYSPRGTSEVGRGLFGTSANKHGIRALDRKKHTHTHRETPRKADRQTDEIGRKHTSS